MNRLAILEENLEYSRKILNCIISNNKKIRIINISTKLEEMVKTLELLNEKDILLLDLNLPKADIDQLVAILDKKEKQAPHIIGITNNMKQCEK